MSFQGHFRKMKVEHAKQVQYYLVLDDQKYHLNPHLGQRITIEYLDDIHCMVCGKSTAKSFNQGFCYKCFQMLARNDRCMMSPELCHYDKGTCREPEWGISHCMQPHIVYLSFTSDIKVGITRAHQYITRWIDQGATQAIAVCQVKTRRESGLVENHLRQWYQDRTQWKAMLGGNTQADLLSDIDLVSEKEKVIAKLKDFDVEVLDGEVHHFEYPVDAIGPLSILSLDKQKQVSGYLLGIKGQYLILDTGVINIRKHGSYLVNFTVG